MRKIQNAIFPISVLEHIYFYMETNNVATFFLHWVENEDRVGSYVLLFNSRKTKGRLSVITYDIQHI